MSIGTIPSKINRWHCAGNSGGVHVDSAAKHRYGQKEGATPIAVDPLKKLLTSSAYAQNVSHKKDTKSMLESPHRDKKVGC